MTAQVLFNPLTYIDRLTRGGFTPEQARASAEALETAFTETVATKADVADIRSDFSELRRDFSELGRDFSELRRDVAHDVNEVESRLRLEISQSKNDILRWMFGFNLAMIGAIFAIVKFVQ